MAFKDKEKEVRMEPDCEDFVPYKFNKKYCKLSSKCANAGTEYESHCEYLGVNLCTGISWQRIYIKIGLTD